LGFRVLGLDFPGLSMSTHFFRALSGFIKT